MSLHGRHVRNQKIRWDKQVWLVEPETKRCSTCGQLLPLAEFSKNRCMRDGYQNVCNGCKHDYWNRWYHSTRTPEARERTREQGDLWQFKRRLRHYGLTPEDYDRLAAQGCAICGGPPGGGNRYRRYALDHDHETGEFRGLLCSSCNRGMGWFRDNPRLLAKAIAYLRPRQLRLSTTLRDGDGWREERGLYETH